MRDYTPKVAGRSSNAKAVRPRWVALRVRKGEKGKDLNADGKSSRRPQSGSLKGRFLPADSGDFTGDQQTKDTENPDAENFDNFGDVREGLPRLGRDQTEEVKWNRRAEAAKKRWANPEYRKKMMEKRLEKKMSKEKKERPPRVEIGSMDSVTLSPDDKAAAINAYALANQRRSEKLEKHHRQQQKWMEERLASGEEFRNRLNNDEFKRERQEERRRVSAERMKKRQDKEKEKEKDE